MKNGRRGPSDPVEINCRGAGVGHELAQRRRRAAPAVAEHQAAAAKRHAGRVSTILLTSTLHRDRRTVSHATGVVRIATDNAFVMN